MIKSPAKRLFLLALLSFAFYSCTKTYDATTVLDTPPATANGLHVYGLNEMQPSDWANVPVFSTSLFGGNKQVSGLTYSGGTLPGSYLLFSPQIRDQGQIGSCTGFCGAETDEILYYYNNTTNPAAAVNSLAVSNGASTASANQIPNTSEAPPYTNNSNAFSPLFLYFVERVVINKQSISTDAGANMVNICQALQGVSASGSALTYGGYTFLGIPPEANYKYPFVKSSTSNYNVATASTYPYQTYPYNYFSYNSTTIPVAPYNYPISAQSGSTNSSGTTSSGYYVINSTKSQLVTDVKTAIANKKPVMMGFNVYDKKPSYPYFETLNTTKYTYNPLTTSGSLISGLMLLGGHAVPIIGYIDDSSQPGGGVFICQNSWGSGWGYKGYFYMPYLAIQNTSVVPAGNLYVAVQ